MRLFALGASLLLAAFDAIAQGPTPKEVEIINTPLEVEVASAPPPLRWQLVGFTNAAYTGNLGGHFGATQKCQIEFPDSRMCLAIEAKQTTTLPAGLSGRAWTNVAIDGVDGPISENSECLAWLLDSSGAGGGTVDERGVVSLGLCHMTRPIACCALVP